MAAAAAYEADKLEQMQAEFEEKSQILARYFPELPPELYLEDLFGCRPEMRVMNFAQAAPGQRIRAVDGWEQMLAIDITGRKDAFYYAADFFKPYPRKQLLRNMYALIVDLDSVSPKTVSHLIEADFWGLCPAYVVNSGHGLHLVYAFEDPVACYDRAKIQLAKLYDELKQHFVSNKCHGIQYIVDEKISILQSYRMPGSLTKIDTICAVYRSGGAWTPERLAAAAGISWQVRKPHPNSPALSRPEQSARQGKIADVSYLPTPRKGFYEKTKIRMIQETPVGNRYYSMFALAIVAYKCLVPRTQLEQDLDDIRKAYNARDKHEHTVKRSEVDKAICGYNPKALTVKRSTLCGWLGFGYDAAKRNGRTRDEHLAEVHAKRSDTARIKIMEYFSLHPDASNVKASRDLGMSRHTVIKYRPAADAPAHPQLQEERPQTMKKPKTINEMTSRVVAEADERERELLIALQPQPIVRGWGLP